MDGREGKPSVVVDGNEQRLPAGTFDAVLAVACDSMTWPNDLAKLLGVDVQQITRRLVLVAHDGLYGLQILELGQPSSLEDTADRGLRDADTAGNASLRHSTSAELDDEKCLGCVDGSWRAHWP